MRDFLKKHKSEIIVGVVVFFITTFLGKIGSWFMSATPKIGSSVLDTIQNTIYTLAATQTSGSFILVIICVSFGVLFGSIAPPLKESISGFITALRIEKDLKTFSDKDIEELNKYIQTKSDEKPSRPPETVNDTLKKHKHSGFQAIILILLMIVFYIVLILFVFMPMTIRDKFDQDITIIYPYVGEQQVLQLKSDWVQMRSKTDYASIYEYIDTAKEENNLLR